MENFVLGTGYIYALVGFAIGSMLETAHNALTNKRKIETLISDCSKQDKKIELLCEISSEHDFVIGEILECSAITEEYLQRNPTALIGPNKKV